MFGFGFVFGFVARAWRGAGAAPAALDFSSARNSQYLPLMF